MGQEYFVSWERKLRAESYVIMLKSGQKRPNTPNKTKSEVTGSPDAAEHWRQGVRETVITARPDGSLNFSVHGGSDKGEFAYVSHIVQNKVHYVSGKLNEEDILLEIQGQKVAGYTQRDVVAWLNHCCRNGNPVVLKTVDAGEYESGVVVLMVERLLCFVIAGKL